MNRLGKTALATALVVVIGLLTMPNLWRRNAEQLAELLATRIATADDMDVKIPLRQLANLGQPAIEPLVVAAASERSTVATIAQRIIDELLGKLTNTASIEADGPLSEDDSLTAATLAESLARHIHDFGPAGKRWAENITLALIEFTDQLPIRHSRKLLHDCENVLAAVPPRGRRVRTVVQLSENPANTPAPSLPAPAPELMPLTRVSEQSLEILARIEPGSVQQPKTNLLTRPPQIATPNTLPQPRGRDLKWSTQPQTLAQAKPLPRPEADSTTKSTLPIPSPHNLSQSRSVIDVPTPHEMEDHAERLSDLSDEALFLKLEDASRFRAGTIRSVLMERGYDATEIALRLRITSVGAGERLQLLDLVDELSASAATRTLRWLLQDKSGDVRLRALTALATTRSPDVAEIARDLATHDEDPRVAKLASKLIR